MKDKSKATSKGMQAAETLEVVQGELSVETVGVILEEEQGEILVVVVETLGEAVEILAAVVVEILAAVVVAASNTTWNMLKCTGRPRGSPLHFM